jgi:hypothetical protein
MMKGSREIASEQSVESVNKRDLYFSGKEPGRLSNLKRLVGMDEVDPLCLQSGENGWRKRQNDPVAGIGGGKRGEFQIERIFFSCPGIARPYYIYGVAQAPEFFGQGFDRQGDAA